MKEEEEEEEEEAEEEEEEDEEEEDGSIRSSISIYAVLLSYNDYTQHNNVHCTQRVRMHATMYTSDIRNKNALPPCHPCVDYWEFLGSRY